MSSFSSFTSLGSLTDTGLANDPGICTFLYDLFRRANDTEQQRKYTDACIVLEYNGCEYTFFAHKMVLSMRSPYLADKFYGSEKVENCLKLKDIHPEDCEVALKYMYDMDPSIITPKKACDIYKVAKELQVFTLMDLCKQQLNQIKVVPSNVFDMLKASDYLQSKSTRDRCLKLFQENTEEVIAENQDLCEISPSMMKILLSSKHLSLKSLLDLFVWVFAWAKNWCLKDHRFHSARVPLEELLPHLPFPSLKVEEFAELYKRYKDSILNKDEIISIFMDYSLPGGQMPYWYNKECKVEIIQQSNI